MIEPQPIGFLNTGLPVLLLGAGAVILPRPFAGAATLSQRRLALGVVFTALVLVIFGALEFAVIYAVGGASVLASFSGSPVGVAAFFIGLSAKAGLFWAPILALVWFVLAQSVERRRGEAIARLGGGADGGK